jgi:hypothetical protein
MPRRQANWLGCNREIIPFRRSVNCWFNWSISPVQNQRINGRDFPKPANFIFQPDEPEFLSSL